jgi:hypothetical protein
VKCSACGESIDHILIFKDVVQVYKLVKTGETKQVGEQVNGYEYQCPKCFEYISEDEKRAMLYKIQRKESKQNGMDET